jgi:hypothetical protein
MQGLKIYKASRRGLTFPEQAQVRAFVERVVAPHLRQEVVTRPTADELHFYMRPDPEATRPPKPIKNLAFHS